LENVLTNVERINELELALTAFNSKRSLSQNENDLSIKKIGASTLLIDSKVPDSIYYNRIKGFGMTDLDKMEEILDIYDTEKITPCFDMTPNNITMEVSQALMNKGYFCFEQLNFLEIEPHFTKCENEEIKIVKVTENNVEEFLNLISLQTGREITEDLIKKKAEYYYQPNFQNYIAYFDDQAAGVASLFRKGEEGYLANAFTFPSVRGKGVQKELLKRRIQVSHEIGLKKLYTDVEFGSISHNNMLKLGFKSIYLNSFWMKSKLKA
jgi:N-acetylglutamate synthase-like GNAT family acetyltransferase